MFCVSIDKIIAPWYHYIPLKPDYSDLYDIMAFFVGPLDDAGHVDFSKGHDVSIQMLITSTKFSDLLHLVFGQKDWKRWPEIRVRALVMGRYASLRESPYSASIVR